MRKQQDNGDLRGQVKNDKTIYISERIEYNFKCLFINLLYQIIHNTTSFTAHAVFRESTFLAAVALFSVGTIRTTFLCFSTRMPFHSLLILMKRVIQKFSQRKEKKQIEVLKLESQLSICRKCALAPPLGQINLSIQIYPGLLQHPAQCLSELECSHSTKWVLKNGNHLMIFFRCLFIHMYFANQFNIGRPCFWLLAPSLALFTRSHSGQDVSYQYVLRYRQ